MTIIKLEGFGDITVNESTYLPLNYTISDLRDPFTQSSSFSNEIQLIGDNKTNSILGYAFDVNVQNQTFDRNKKVACQIRKDDDIVFDDSFFKLTDVKVERVEDKNVISYTAIVLSDLSDFFTQIKGKDLKDLNISDFSTYSVLNKNNVENSFLKDYTDKWKYVPMYKQNNPTSYSVKNFTPGIFAKTFWDQMHTDAGWSYTMETEVEDKLNKLIIPYTGEYDADDIAKDKLSVIVEDNTFHQNNYSCRSGYLPYSFTNTRFGSEEDFTIEVRDDVGQFTLFNDTFTAASNSDYTFVFEMNFDHIMTNPAPGDAYVQGQNNVTGDNLTIQYELRYTIVDTNGNFSQGVKILDGVSKVFLDRNDPNFDWSVDGLAPGSQSVNSGIANCSFTLSLVTGDMVFDYLISETYVNSNDVGTPVLWKYRAPITGTQNPNTACSVLNINSIQMTITPDLQYGIGTPIYLQDFIPKDISQRDYLSSFLKMFNLIAETTDKTIVYTTRDKFYDEGDFVSWTDKLQSSINLEWLVDSQSKILNLSYTPGEDEINTGYTENVKQVYGEYKHDFENDYNIGRDREEIIFSPTPLLYQEFTGMYLPGISMGEHTELNIRLLIDGGSRNGYYTIQNDDGSYGNPGSKLYPYFGHFDDPINPSYDINFGKCDYYFYNQWSSITNNNLVNQYHRRSLNQLTKGRILTAIFKLTSLDIKTMRLSDNIEIKNDTIGNGLWNIQQIVDYNAGGENFTKVVLVSVDDGLTVPYVKTITGNPTPSKPSPHKPNISRPIGKTNEYESYTSNIISPYFQGKVIGEDNTLSNDSSGWVLGDNNKVDSNSFIMGKNNNTNVFGNKMIVGNDIIADQLYTGYFDKVKLGPDLNVDGTVYGSDGISFKGSYVTDGYVETGYVENYTGSILLSSDISGITVTIDTDLTIGNVNKSNPFTIDTTTNTPQVLIEIPIVNDSVKVIRCNVMGLRDDYTQSISSVIETTVRNNNGTLSTVGTDTITTKSDFSSADVTVSFSGNNVLISVTGESSNISWGGNYTNNSLSI